MNLLGKSEGLYTDMASEVTAELDQRKRPWYLNLSILAVTVALFVGLGLLGDGIQGALILVVVILIHELGHLAAMKISGYGNTQVFFVPLFGAGVAYKAASASGNKRAMVDLAGPIPGILLAIVLTILYWITDIDIYREIAYTAVFLNLFNLLPLFPLDGGRFMFDVLFVRHRIAEVVFKIIAALCIFGLSVVLEAWFLSIIGIFTIISIPASVKTAKLALSLKQEFGDEMPANICEAPADVRQRVVEKVMEKIPGSNARQTAARVRDVWDRVIVRPPPLSGIVGFLFLYVFFLLLGALLLLLLTVWTG